MEYIYQSEFMTQFHGYRVARALFIPIANNNGSYILVFLAQGANGVLKVYAELFSWIIVIGIIHFTE